MAKRIEFFEHEIDRMSCGGLLLDISRRYEHSVALRSVGVVSADTARKYVQAWQDNGFLDI